MTESEAKLVRMATEIHQFFRHQGDAAAPAAANHIRQFWAPPMRADFLAIAQREGDNLSEPAQSIATALESA